MWAIETNIIRKYKLYSTNDVMFQFNDLRKPLCIAHLWFFPSSSSLQFFLLKMFYANGNRLLIIVAKMGTKDRDKKSESECVRVSKRMSQR